MKKTLKNLKELVKVIGIYFKLSYYSYRIQEMMKTGITAKDLKKVNSMYDYCNSIRNSMVNIQRRKQ